MVVVSEDRDAGVVEMRLLIKMQMYFKLNRKWIPLYSLVAALSSRKNIQVDYFHLSHFHIQYPVRAFRRL